MMKRCLLLNSILISIAVLVIVSFSVPVDVYAEEQDDEEKAAGFPSYENCLEKYRELKQKNDHTVGWIYIDGTKVDNVVMQNKDEKDFYIDKGFDREYSYPGTLYISDISDLAKPSDVVIMYGHNMKDRSMFGSLREFEDPEFLKAHDTIIMDDLEGRKEYEITHVMRIRVNVPGGDIFPYYTYSDFENEEDYDAFMKQCDGHVLYDSGKTTEYGDKFVMLTTCEYTYPDGTGRLVIMGKYQAPEPDSTEPAVTAKEEVKPAVSPLTIILIIGGILLAALITIFIILLRRKRK